uniref:Putative methyltransferase n=3 Tax=viral metagenome TaxID=1070528 RepID=A0A6M3JM90_9ZZZZ
MILEKGGKQAMSSEILPFPDKKYQIILADPPWSYRNKKVFSKFKNKLGYVDGGCLNKYPTMSLDEICNLPLGDIADKNSVLFLWATVPLLPEAFQVLTAWGFKYKTMLTWRKIMSLGMGFWFRGQCEHLILGIKGKIPAFRLQESNFIQCKVLRHSKKPHEFRQLIERATQKMTLQNRIELFARQKTDGWDVWGNEV